MATSSFEKNIKLVTIKELKSFENILNNKSNTIKFDTKLVNNEKKILQFKS